MTDIANWYVLYTKPRWEKKVEQELLNAGFQTFLPLQKTLKQWSDRKKWVEEPLFRSYIFVKTNLAHLKGALEARGVVSIVKHLNKPALVREEEIEAIKQYLGETVQFDEKYEMPKKGSLVEISGGPLKGLSGILVEYKTGWKVVVNINAINKNLWVTVHTSLLSKKEA